MDRYTAMTSKLVTLEEAKKRMEIWSITDKKVVFTNGCFDILHKGHVTYLAKAACFGERMVIGLNTDASVRRQGKGEERPINDELARAMVLSALSFVDLVVLFDKDTPLDLIEELKPNVLVKGADYDAAERDESKKSYIVGSKEIEALGGSVKTVELEEGFSTTGIVNKLKA